MTCDFCHRDIKKTEKVVLVTADPKIRKVCPDCAPKFNRTPGDQA